MNGDFPHEFGPARLEISGCLVETLPREAIHESDDPEPRRTMTAIDDALARLDPALVRLEATVTRRLEAERSPDERETELALMAEDRARLAAALDAASARLAEVEVTVDAVGQRLDRAIDAVEGVLPRPADDPRPAA